VRKEKKDYEEKHEEHWTKFEGMYLYDGLEDSSQI